MILQELVDVGNVKISDSLLDANNVVMKVGDDPLRPGSEVRKLFSCSTKQSMKFKLPNFFLNQQVNSSRQSFFLLINVKMPTIVCILTFTSMINFMLS